MIEAIGCPQTLSGEYVSWQCLWRVMRRKALAPRGELPTRTAEPPCALLTASGVKRLGRQVLKMPRRGCCRCWWLFTLDERREVALSRRGRTVLGVLPGLCFQDW